MERSSSSTSRTASDLEDGFADAEGNPNTDMPTTQTTVTFDDTAGRAARVW